jgi:hypothetical protein
VAKYGEPLTMMVCPKETDTINMVTKSNTFFIIYFIRVNCFVMVFVGVLRL